MKNLKRNRNYNRLVEIIENTKNREQHLESLHNMVDTFLATFKSRRKTKILRKLIHGEQPRLKMRTMLDVFVGETKF